MFAGSLFALSDLRALGIIFISLLFCWTYKFGFFFFLIPLTALSQVISEDLMVNHFLPGLRCLRTDMEHLSPEHEVSHHDD